MRPVNLIPPEERRGDRSELRKGALAYVVVGLLAVALIVSVAMVTISSQISDRETQLASLKVREDAARARADALAPYAQFATMSAARHATVTSLAKSRFDWERVLRELALVIPDDVWLVTTTGTVAPDLQIEGSTGNPLRGQAAGPALELTGCAAGQDSVAEFVAALKDIDGVTRVGLNSSELPLSGSTAAPSSEGGSDGSDCRTRDFIAKFEIVVAFDAVPAPLPADATAPSTAPAATVPAATATPAEVPGAAEATAEEQKVRDSTSKQTDRSRQATEIIPGGGE